MRYAVLIMAVLVLSCRDRSPAPQKQETTAIPECFQYAAGKDTITLQLSYGSTITGTLDYNWNEKDDNRGNITGNMKDDLLVADYTFMSEGITSVRQVVFKKIDQGYVEGYGDMEMQGERLVFKDLTSLRLNDSIILAPVNCK